jgi:hypothetical protein
MQKFLAIQFRYSNTFVYKAACKFCCSGPVRAYFVANVDHSQDFFKFFLKKKPNNYKPSQDNGKFISAVVAIRKFKVAYLFERDNAYERRVFIPNSKFELDKDIISCRAECNCGATCWAFTNSRRKHISNRKSLKPIKFHHNASNAFCV